MSTERIRVILKDSVVEHDLLPLARRNNWRNEDRFVQDGDKPQEYVYTTRDEATKLHWIEDHKLGVNYILVKGTDAERIAGILSDELENYDSEDIIERARDANVRGERRRETLYHLALDKLEHGFDEETFAIFERAMVDDDPVVRGAAVLGAAYLGWQQLAAPLKTLAGGKEPDDSIRKDAAALAQRLAQQA